MKKIKIEIGGKSYTVELAETPEQHDKGLQERKELKENEGMLFVFEEDDEKNFWMKDTEIPLDLIFINEELEVTSVKQGTPNSLEYITGEGCYVLEVNQESGIKKGDELDFSPENKQTKKTDKMLVLDSAGGTQMELDGGERIFSRAHTKTLIKFAKKAATTDSDNDYKALGKRMFKFLQVQSDTDPEYVESKN